MQEIESQIAEIFSVKLNLKVPDVDVELIDSGILDSMGFVDLLVHLEENFHTKFDIEQIEVDDFRSIAKIARYLVSENVASV